MARIAGVTLPKEKTIETALTYIFGIGIVSSQKILKQANIKPGIRTGELSDDQANALREIIEKNHKVEGDLKREILTNIKRLKETNSYRGSRHAKGLPVRGQRTKTNTRTVRGNVRKTVASGRKQADQKT
ncbi:30S ribosomal protein S13 [Patescibacteria group bacterium]|nr:30S ribosomal protein S13 [Patescibacteria group bacterium]MBU1074596.1 30S ribosomal protein S13 [Patescibacteria group bacterium]MBU1952385.1 30S ribosomal protein S13 [Patescibacteria group bacterium]